MDLNELTKNPEQIKNLIQLLQALLPEADQEGADNKQTHQASEQKQEEFTAPLRTRGKRTTQKFKNKFVDMAEKDMHKDDVAIDQKLSRFPPVSRGRNFQMVDVVCRVCGKKETISPSLLFDTPARYKCNNCSTSAG